MSSRVNEMVRQRENRSNLRELVNKFCGDNKSQLLRSNRVLVYEGFLYKVRKYKIKYYFHLFSDIIVYSNINNNGLYNIHRILDLHKIAVVDLPNIDENAKNNDKKKGKNKRKKKKYKTKIWYRFLLRSQEKSFELLTENEQEKQNWLLLIGAAISRLKNVNNNSTSPKTPQSQISDYNNNDGNNTPTITPGIDDEDYYAPYWVPDDASNNCSCCNSEFTVLNRRHHCRRCGNLVCKTCCKNTKLLINIDKNKAVKICDICYQYIQTQQPQIQQTQQPLFNDCISTASTEDSLDLNNIYITPRKAMSIDESLTSKKKKSHIRSNTKTSTRSNKKKKKKSHNRSKTKTSTTSPSDFEVCFCCYF